MSDLDRALRDAGGTAAPSTATAHLRDLLASSLRDGRDQLSQPRSGYREPVVVAVAAMPRGELVAVLPVAVALRADPDAVPERAWLLTAAAVGALVEVAGVPAPRGPDELHLRAGDLDGFMTLHYPGGDGDSEAAELAAVAFDEHVGGIDRLRAQAHALPAAVLGEGAADVREPIGAGHPLRVAETVARLGGRPADPLALDELEDSVVALLEPGSAHHRPHEDPDPALRVARRVLQRLSGMGKWGGYHTEFAHLPRGFAGNERALAMEVGEALLGAGLLAEKPSVGQRHVFLNPRRARDIHRMIETGEVPPGLKLPS